MIKLIKDFLGGYGLSEQLALRLSNAIIFLSIILVSVLAYLIAKGLILKILRALISRSKTKWDDALIKNKVFERASLIVPALVVHACSSVFSDYQGWIRRMVFCYIVFVVLSVLDKLLDTVDEIYRTFEVSRERPIKGLLQVLKIISYVVGIVVIISALIERSPWVLLSGIGAATAVLLLIFQNSILGFVAGIQLSSNNMVRLGDWIEMPKYGADGAVVEISLHTVKVKNWDQTITTIPTYSLISESFKNWRGMQESGGRRIKRSIYIDMASIQFCTEEMLEKYKGIQYIREYLENKNNEIEEYNKEYNIDSSSIVNGRHLTNIGTFRAYVQHYLNHHPRIHDGMIRMVRQLAPTEKGLPIEIYVFTNDTAWVNYEAIQADIFDHILAVIPEFDLRIFQEPSGHDLRQIKWRE